MALVKFTTTEDLDRELESIKMTQPNCNTNAAAAKLAIENYLSLEETVRDLRKSLDQADNLLIKIYREFNQIETSKARLQELMNDIM